MNNKWLYLFAWILFIQPMCTQAVWKQISESPFAIKAEPDEGEVQNGPRQVSYSPDGAFLAVANPRDASGSGAESGSVSMFSVEKQTGFLTELDNSPFSVNTTGGGRKTIGLSFAPQGVPTLSTANILNPIKLFSFNTQTGELFNLRTVNSSSCVTVSTLSVAYSPAGTYLAASTTPNVYLVNQTTGDLTCQQETNSPLLSFPRSIAYYPLITNQSYVAVIENFSLTEDVVIFSSDPDTGIISNSKAFKLRDGDIAPHWVDFSPDGRFIAVAVVDGVEVRKFRATGFNAPTLLPLNNSTSFFPTPATAQENSGVRSVAYSPDGRWLATANANETISVFCVDQETGALFNRQDLVVGHIGNLGTSDLTFSVIFSPDSTFLAASNRDDNSISVFTNPSAGCPTCNTMLNLSNNSACTASTQESSVESKI